MGSTRAGGNDVDLWSELIAAEQEENNHHLPLPQQRREPQIAAVYTRKIATDNNAAATQRDASKRLSSSSNRSRVSLAPTKRISWNRSLSTRGRESIAVAACVEYQHQQRKPKRKTKPAIPRGKPAQPPNYEKERAYFQEVDSFELLEESPSPKKSATWVQSDDIAIPHMSTALRKWLISKKLNRSCGPSASLSKLLGTPALSGQSIRRNGSNSSCLETPSSMHIDSGLHMLKNKFNSSFTIKEEFEILGDEGFEEIDEAVRKLSIEGHHLDPFLALLAVCGQSSPSMLLDVFSKFCDPETIIKVGEGTYGEAFQAGNAVCKIVPVDGDLKVNGEVQKRSDELLEEAILSRTLNHLRALDGQVTNSCTTFIQTLEVSVCQGPYDVSLIRAWEEWDTKHVSENDHPKEFPEKQTSSISYRQTANSWKLAVKCLIAVMLHEHGGQDLESFVLLNFNEARSLLVQVTVALAVAEAAYEFEHRDLHWGNILLSRKDSATLLFTMEGKPIFIRTFGLVVSIIDFTLSRINTGDDILFLDLSLDPELFEGPKGDKQADTYRKMRDVTEDCWEGSFPKTNVLWLQYLVDILLSKKSYDRTTKDERDMRSLKKRLNSCNSAREAISDPFFRDLFVDHAM